MLYPLIFLFAIALAISIVIGLISYWLSEKTPDKEKSSSYECGFNPIYNTHNPFSIKFFIIAILFLVFDLEIIILFPWSLAFKYLLVESCLGVCIFLITLIIGLIYEWLRGGLEWE